MAEAGTLAAQDGSEKGGKLQEPFKVSAMTLVSAGRPLTWKAFTAACPCCKREKTQKGVKLIEASFGEGPRFHEGRLVFSDMHMGEIISLDPANPGSPTITKVDFDPSGLGWLPDGRMVAVAMKELSVYVQQSHGGFELYSDLSQFSAFKCNDMCAAADGTLYVGNFGFDLQKATKAMFSGVMETTLVQVRLGGEASVATKGMRFPNGLVITPDGKTLIVGETFGQRLTAFTIQEDGSLSDRRVWAAVPGVPDGICLDDEGCIWYATPLTPIFKGGIVRVREGGEIVQTIGFGAWPEGRMVYACCLGTVAGQHKLFVCEGGNDDPHECKKIGKKSGAVWMFDAPAGPAKRQGDARYCGGYC